MSCHMHAHVHRIGRCTLSKHGKCLPTEYKRAIVGLVQACSHTSPETLQIDSLSKRTKWTTRGPCGCWNSTERKFLRAVNDSRCMSDRFSIHQTAASNDKHCLRKEEKRLKSREYPRVFKRPLPNTAMIPCFFSQHMRTHCVSISKPAIEQQSNPGTQMHCSRFVA